MRTAPPMPPMPPTPGPARRRAFTLVELLVVVAVIALLVGALFPALSKARLATQRVQSMSNVRQITLAAISYAAERGEWPVIPIRDNEFTTDFNSWNFGGKSNDDSRWSKTSLNYVAVEDRVLNPYLYPDATLRDPEDAAPGEDPRVEVPIFRCPGDRGSYQKSPGWFNDQPLTPDPFISSYDDVGTSYHLNVKWFYYWVDQGANKKETWQRLKTMFRRANLDRASRFVWLHDQVMDVGAVKGQAVDGNFGGSNKSVAAFMDGHVEYLTVELGELEGDGYTLIFDRDVDLNQ